MNLDSQLRNQHELSRQIAITRPSFASGPFTYVSFVVSDGEFKIAVPRNHAVGDRGDSVYNISGLVGSYNFR